MSKKLALAISLLYEPDGTISVHTITGDGPLNGTMYKIGSFDVAKDKSRNVVSQMFDLYSTKFSG